MLATAAYIGFSLFRKMAESDGHFAGRQRQRGSKSQDGRINVA
jgi:hypothetical protein